MFGMMLPTWFLSMWISNTATTAMMIPIANAVLVQLKETKDRENSDISGSHTVLNKQCDLQIEERSSFWFSIMNF